MSTALILAALPSPSSNAIDVGPLSIRAYGEAIGIGVGARRAQELFGRPSDLRWALRIDPQHRPDGFADVATYHPSFLYGASDRSRHGDRRVRVNIWVSSAPLIASLACSSSGLGPATLVSRPDPGGARAQAIGAVVFFTGLGLAVRHRDLLVFVTGLATITAAWFALRTVH